MFAEDEEPIEGRTRLQKLVFLMQQRFKEQDKDPLKSGSYEFIAYDYGPFSKELYDDLDRLIERNKVISKEEPISEGKNKYIYEIQEEGINHIEQQLSKEEAKYILSLAEEIKRENNQIYLSDLIEKVYSQYPEYAKNSIY